jgi:hypothetical protein
LSAVPVTSDQTGWPLRLLTDQASDYLAAVHHLPVDPKLLKALRGRGRDGPRCRWLGTTAIYDRSDLDAWAETEALQDENPTARTRRLCRESVQEAARRRRLTADPPVRRSRPRLAVIAGTDTGKPTPGAPPARASPA